ncbi:hypothetical protein DZB84_05105 [Bacillus sp. HNG]|uniref:hypothetical protein n=1 Tax=Bacillus sp. HNG TaxID=2293325 RepID=UPI000E2EA59A|nr:hypothetical protein [Bacillus sp. HNG]RFB18294.1 hypothetical protein DZB84_05105 [Bacillus sp. HNG]
MDFLSVNDWITPTNPYASLFFGWLFTIVVGVVVWLHTRKIKTLLIVLFTGSIVSIVGVIILKVVGFY